MVRRDVDGLSEQRSDDAHDAEEDDDPDDDDADQKEDQKPEAAAVALSYYDHLWWRRGCLAHRESLSASVKGRRAAVPFRGELACHLILADGHQVRAWLRPESLRLPGFASGCNSAAVSALLEDIPELSVRH